MRWWLNISCYPVVPEEEQTGELIMPAALPKLNNEQARDLRMAKKYCHDITNKFVSLNLFVHCSIYPSIHFHSCIHLSIRPFSFMYPFIHPSIFIHVSIYSSVHSFIYLSIYSFIHVSIATS